jgi:hypothetical protein
MFMNMYVVMNFAKAMALRGYGIICLAMFLLLSMFP